MARGTGGQQAAGVAQLFAHLGLAAVDAVAEEWHGQAYGSYRERAATLPASQPQIKMLLARLCLGTRLNCLSRYLPKSVSQPALRIIDELLVAANLTAAIQSRALLAMRYGGALPGAETTAPAQHISSEAAIERFIAETGFASS